MVGSEGARELGSEGAREPGSEGAWELGSEGDLVNNAIDGDCKDE